MFVWGGFHSCLCEDHLSKICVIVTVTIPEEGMLVCTKTVWHWMLKQMFEQLVKLKWTDKYKSVSHNSGLFSKGWAGFNCPYSDLQAGRVPVRRGRSSWCRWWRWWGPHCCEGWTPSAGSEASKTWRGLFSHPASAGTCAPIREEMIGIMRSEFIIEQLCGPGY